MNAKTLWTFAISSLAVFMTTLDNLVVTSAIPVIRRDLQAGINGRAAASRARARCSRTRCANRRRPARVAGERRAAPRGSPSRRGRAP
jgi:hypothetical protein